MLPPVPGSPAFPGSHAIAWPGSHLPISARGKKIGIIGLDTSHSEAFAKALNTATVDTSYNGYRVTAAYSYGSKKITSSYNRIPGYIEKVKGYGVQSRKRLCIDKPLGAAAYQKSKQHQGKPVELHSF